MSEDSHIDFPLINAVIQKKQEGFIREEASWWFVHHKSGFSYLKVKDNTDYGQVLDFFENSPELPVYFHLYDPPEDLVNLVKTDQRFGNKYRKRIQLRYMKKEVGDVFRKQIGGNYSFAVINRNNFKRLQVFDLDLASKFWMSEDDFLENGYGSVIFKAGKEPVSVCYSSCVAGKIAEIDVATLEAYRGEGLAKAVTESFVDASLQKGIQANWDCFEANTPSLKTAEALGFDRLKEYWFLSVYNEMK